MSRALCNLLGIAAVALACSATRASAEWVDWILDANAAWEFTNNLNNSSFDEDEEHDHTYFVGVEGGRVYQLTDRTRLSLSATFLGELHHNFDDLDSYEPGGRISLFHKFGVGNAPWLRPFFWGGYKGVREDDRSGGRFEVGLAAGKRFTPRADLALSYRYTYRDGGNGPVANPAVRTDVFDQQFHLVTLSGNFLVLEPLLVTVGYTFRYGDFDSACSSENVATVFRKADVKAIALDGVFGGCVYRLKGAGHAPFVNFSWGITDRISLDAGYRFQFGKAQQLDYNSHTTRLTVLFRY
jgi:hypothetical protein